MQDAQRLVWDLPVRIIHWLLALAVAGSWLTHALPGDWFTWHRRCGYTVLLLVATRLIWGLLGTRHARFVSFVRGPGTVWRYARSLFSAQTPSYVGHNPLGALMVLALLGLLLAQACTGLFANDDVANTGPLYGYVSDSLSHRLTGWHHRIFNFISVAVAVHVCAALFYLIVKRDNLIFPMITGRKSAAQVPLAAAIASSRSWLALLIAALLASVLWYVVRQAPAPEMIGI